MTISVSEAFSTFCSPRMNKTLILIYLAAYSLLMLPYMMYSYSKNLGYLIPGYLLYFLAIFLLPGVQVITVNRLVNGEENTVPQLSESLSVLCHGLKMTVWSMIVGFVMVFPAMIIFFLAAFIFFKSEYMSYIMAGGFLLLILAVLILTFRYTIPAYCLYAKTMKFTSLFNIKHICEFMKPRERHYGAYLLKIFAVAVLYFILLSALFFAFCICVFLANGLQTDTIPDKLLFPLYFLYMLVSGLFGFAVYIPMTAQFINSETDSFTEEIPAEDSSEEDDEDDDFI